MNKTLIALFFLLFLADQGLSQLVPPDDIESSTHLFRGGVSDEDGKNKSYNRSFTTPDGVVFSESGDSMSLSGSYNNLESHNLNFTSSKKIEDLVVKRRVSKSWSTDIVNTFLNDSVPKDLKLSFSTRGRVILKGNATASLNLKLQLGNRHSGFIFKTLSYAFKPSKGFPGKVDIYNKHNVLLFSIPNGGNFKFSYTDNSYRIFVGKREAVFTVDSNVETSPAEGFESYGFLKADSSFDLIK